MTTYGVTGASGQLGTHIVEALMAKIDPGDLVLLSRTPETLSKYAPAVRRAADFSDPESLDRAFLGVDELLLVSIDILGDQRIAWQQSAVAAAARAGVRRILYTSLPGVEHNNPAFVATDHAATEQAIRDCGTRWTFLRNNLYTDLPVTLIGEAAQTGQLVTSIGDGAAAYVTREDCAAAAAAALVSTDLDDSALDITGPDALTAADMAQLATNLRGSAVEIIQLDESDRVARLVAAGYPEPAAALFASFDAAIREGFLANVSTAVPDLTGCLATPVSALIGDTGSPTATRD